MFAFAAFGVAGRLLASEKKAEKHGDLVLNEPGGYWFQPGLPFLSYAARAADGYEIVRATFRSLRPFARGMDDIAAYLQAAGRPIQALCGLELRSDDTSAKKGMPFMAFNRLYSKRLSEAGLTVGGKSPLTRVCVSAPGVTEHSIYAFTYTVPLAEGRKSAPPTFMTCAFPDAIGIGTPQQQWAAKGDTSLAGMRKKMEVVIGAVDDSLQKLETRWADVTGVQLYSVYDCQPLYDEFLSQRLGAVARRGIEWYSAKPPAVDNDLEIAVRGTRLEVLIED